jgi:hypothetical protein
VASDAPIAAPIARVDMPDCRSSATIAGRLPTGTRTSLSSAEQ